MKSRIEKCFGLILLTMNRSLKKTQNSFKPVPSPSRQPSAGSRKRPIRCYNCQKFLPADNYDHHHDTCNRFKDKSSMFASTQARGPSTSVVPASKPTSTNTLETTVQKATQQNRSSQQDPNPNKSRLFVNNNVVIPGNASSNITRKGPNKSIVNPSIAQRRPKKSLNPEEKTEEQKREQESERKIQEAPVEKKQVIGTGGQAHNNIAQEKQEQRVGTNRPQSGRRVYVRPNSGSRPMQMRIAEQNARLANLYNQGLSMRPVRPSQPQIQPPSPQPEPQPRRVGSFHVNLSSDSEYESSQLNPGELIGDDEYEDYELGRENWRRMEEEENRRIRQIEQEQSELRRRAQEYREREFQRRRERELAERVEIERREQQRQRQREIERERQRERERQLEREREREQREREVIIVVQNQNGITNYNIETLVANTAHIITFIDDLSINDENLRNMAGQLRQLNAIASQIQQLSGLGHNLGFSMSQVFCQRIEQLQNAILHQISIVLVNNFQNAIAADFEALISIIPNRAPTKVNFTKPQIERLFPLKPAPQPGECSICLEEVRQYHIVRELQCRHSFHPDCIDEWLGESRKCPMCRHEQQQSAL